MIGIHARNISKDRANRTRVDDKPENAFQCHSEVKGQMSAFLSQENICMFLNS